MIDAAMMGQMPQPMMPQQAPPPMDENAVLAMLLESVMSRWQTQESQLGGEKDALTQTLLMLAGVGNPALPPDAMMETGHPAGPDAMPPEAFLE